VYVSMCVCVSVHVSVSVYVSLCDSHSVSVRVSPSVRPYTGSPAHLSSIILTGGVVYLLLI